MFGAAQVIDGQQRLTTLVMLLAYLRHWAAAGGNDMLRQRVDRMLHLESDPLDPASVDRHRLQVRFRMDLYCCSIDAPFVPSDCG